MLTKTLERKINMKPDFSVNIREMHEYGYGWDGMLPLKPAMAQEYLRREVPVFRLYNDNTDVELTSPYDVVDDIEEGNSFLYGIQRLDWMLFNKNQIGIGAR